MLIESVQKKIGLLDNNLVKVSSENLHIVEKKSGGEADLTVKLKNPSILFEKLEEKKLGYFINKCCADNVLFEYKNEKWILHIFELKRSVGKSDWGKIKLQFRGALQNAFALSGLLGIKIQMQDIHVYTAYRNDKLNHQANSVKQRVQMYGKEDSELVEARKEWNATQISFDVDETYVCKHTKIKLDVETGEGEFVLI